MDEQGDLLKSQPWLDRGCWCDASAKSVLVQLCIRRHTWNLQLKENALWLQSDTCQAGVNSCQVGLWSMHGMAEVCEG
jgi:hypothetical protein